MPKVTVIVPAYNVEPFIEQCVESALNQTLDDIEFIFIDDGSVDRTGILLDKLTMNNQKARVIHQPNKGLFNTRKIGLSLATGDYVGWIDADDYVEPNMFEVMYEAAIKHDSELVICDYSWFPRKPAEKEKWYREYAGKVDVRFIERNSQVWNKIVKRELLERLNIGQLFIPCFDEVYIWVLMEARNPITINQSLYHYRVGRGTMSSSYNNVQHFRSYVAASENLRDVMRTHFQDPYWTDYFDYRIAYYLLVTMIAGAYSGDREAYMSNREKLRKIVPSYYINRHFWRTLRDNFGLLKAFVIGCVVPCGYTVAHFVCSVAIRP